MSHSMILASGLVWDSILARNEQDETERKKKTLVSDNELPLLAEFAFKSYFGEKNQEKRWYKPEVTVETVLSEFSGANAPISPRNLLSLWRAIPSLQKSFGAVEADKEINQVAALLGKNLNNEEEQPTTSYTKGESTLGEMSAELGDITPTMVNKIFASGVDKLKKMTNGVEPEEMEDEELAGLMDKIANTRVSCAKEFAAALKNFGGNMSAFLEYHVHEQILTKAEKDLIISKREDELFALSLLIHKPIEDIVDILLVDIEEEDNLFKVYQNMVSKKMFPPGKRGRPKGSKNAPKNKTVDLVGEDSIEENDDFEVEVVE